MRKHYFDWKQFVVVFFLCFGVIQLLFFVRNYLPPYSWRGNIYSRDTWKSLFSSILFSGIHQMYVSEGLIKKYTIKMRFAVSIISCAIACGLLTYELGLHNFMPDIPDQTTAVIVWYTALLISFILCMTIAYFVERKFQKIGKDYDAALALYKEKYSSLQNEE